MKNVWYKCENCGNGCECYAFIRGLNDCETINNNCISGDTNCEWHESLSPVYENKIISSIKLYIDERIEKRDEYMSQSVLNELCRIRSLIEG